MFETEEVAGLKKRNSYGILTGMEKGKALKVHPEIVEGLRNHLYTAPGAEDYWKFMERVFKTMTEIIGGSMIKGLSRIAIVSHGGSSADFSESSWEGNSRGLEIAPS